MHPAHHSVTQQVSWHSACLFWGQFAQRHNRILAPKSHQIQNRRNAKILRLDNSANPDGYTDWYEMAVAQPNQVCT